MCWCELTKELWRNLVLQRVNNSRVMGGQSQKRRGVDRVAGHGGRRVKMLMVVVVLEGDGRSGVDKKPTGKGG